MLLRWRRWADRKIAKATSRRSMICFGGAEHLATADLTDRVDVAPRASTQAIWP